MWFEHQHNGVKCPKCKGTGNDIDFKVGLGKDGLVPSYVSQPCSKCKGDGILTDVEKTQWKQDHKPKAQHVLNFNMPNTNTYLIRDSFFVVNFLKWLMKVFGIEVKKST